MEIAENKNLNCTKIVATLGPASDSDEAIRGLILAGVNMFRCNFSHGRKEDQGVHIARVRRLAAEMGHSVAVLADLQGPKFRLAQFEGKNQEERKINLPTGEHINFRSGRDGTLCSMSVLTTGTTHTHRIVRHLEAGNRVLIDDGQIELKVESRVSRDELRCVCVRGGWVRPNKGINVPDMKVRVAAVTDKDMQDAMYALTLNVDYIAMSFVQARKDVLQLKRLIKGFSKKGQIHPLIIAKMEKPVGCGPNLDEIIDEVDSIMVARGDMAVECGLHTIIGFQRDMINRCNAAGKSVIVATDMLKSMIERPFPERPEVSDVAHAVFDGTDAVMLSGESSMGRFPVAAVRTMKAIVCQSENDVRRLNLQTPIPRPIGTSLASNILFSAVSTAHAVNARGIVFVCTTFEEAMTISKMRPPCPIHLLTFSASLAQRAALIYGCHGTVIDSKQCPSLNTDEFLSYIETHILSRGHVAEGERVVYVSTSAPFSGLKMSISVAEMGDYTASHNRREKWHELVDTVMGKAEEKAEEKADEFADKKGVVLIGMPGAGKSTQCNSLLEASHMGDVLHISPGNILRRLESKGDQLADEILAARRAGGLQMDSMNSRIVASELQRDPRQPFITDGFPVTIGAAQHFSEHSPGLFRTIRLVLSFWVSEETAIFRLSNRRIHVPSGRVYHLINSPPQVEGLDDVTGEALEQRRDDHPDIVRRRLAFYNQSIPEVEDFFRSKGIRVQRLDANGTVEEVYEALCNSVSPVYGVSF